MMLAASPSTGLGWVLLAILMAVPWLIPVHTDPWPTLHSEIAAALATVPLAFWVLARSGRAAVDALALGFALAALVPLLQAASGLFVFPAEAPLVSTYLIGIALLAMVARDAEWLAPGRVPDALFSALVIAALISTALALAQWLHLDWGPLLSGFSDVGRPSANVGQPNDLSTLLVWGLIGLWWAHAHRRIGAAVAVLAAATLLVGIAATHSRTGWLAVALLLAAALVAPARFGIVRGRLVFVGLTLWFAALVMGWDATGALVEGSQGPAPQLLRTGDQRTQIWAMTLDGIQLRPWFGYGWNQSRLLQVATLPNHPELRVGVQHAHNLLLDLMVWNGAPLGLAFALGLGAWFVWQWRRATTVAQALLLLALATFGLHCLLELPHTKAFFLVPAALMMGVLNARAALPVLLRIPRAAAAAVGAMLAVALSLAAVEYRAIEVELMAYRFIAARVGTLANPAAPDIRVLSGLQSALVNLRLEPRAGMPADELERLRVTTLRYPIEPAFLKYAKAAALNGQPEAARLALSRWCWLVPRASCAVAHAAWAAFSAEHPQARAVAFPKLD